MTDEYLLEHGYKQYNPTSFDSESVVARFQKRFDAVRAACELCAMVCEPISK